MKNKFIYTSFIIGTILLLLGGIEICFGESVIDLSKDINIIISNSLNIVLNDKYRPLIYVIGYFIVAVMFIMIVLLLDNSYELNDEDAESIAITGIVWPLTLLILICVGVYMLCSKFVKYVLK